MDLLSLGKKPVSKDNPVGEDVRSLPEYELLQEEIDKLSSPSASTGVDWEKVGELSQEILDAKSKHLLVAIYLSQSLLLRQGMEGLAIGSEILKDLLKNYWETLYPGVQRMRARKNALVWWINSTVNAISNVQQGEWAKKDIEGVIKNLQTIESFIQDHLEDPPTLNPLIHKVSALLSSSQPEPTEAAAAEGPKTSAAPSQISGKSSMGDAVSSDDPQKLLHAGLNLLAQASNLWMRQEGLNPLPFLINRIVAWLPVEALPPADDGKTRIPPPEPQLLATLDSLYRERRWPDLLEAAESRVRQYLFWLDLSRFTFAALEEMGKPEISVLVANETISFVQKLSGVEKLRFADGMPFASEETLDWIQEMRKNQAPEENFQQSSVSFDDEISDYLKKAEKQIKNNKITPVLKEFQIKRNQAFSLRNRLLWDMGFCKLLIPSKFSRLVIPYLHGILDTITQCRVEEWEPALAVEALSLVLTGLRKQKPAADTGADYRRLSEEVINRLSLLNPVKAMEYV